MTAPMNWIDIVWPFMGAASLTLALIHFLVWMMERRQTPHLVFAVIAAAVAAISIFELLTLRAAEPAQYAVLLRWAHVPYAVTIVGIAVFVHLRFGAGRVWLAVLAIAMRVFCLLPNFLSGVNLNFLAIEEMVPVSLWADELVYRPRGTVNPWMGFAQVSSLMLVLYLVDTIVAVWRRGNPNDRGRVLLVCGSFALFLVAFSLWGILIPLGFVRAPLMLNPAFLVVLVATSHELGGDVLHAARLAGALATTESDLRASRVRMELALRAAGIGMWDWDFARRQTWFSEPKRLGLPIQPNEPVEQERFLACVHPEDHVTLLDAVAAARSAGDYECEYRTVAGAGGVRWIASRGSVEFDAHGVPVRLYGILADVTQRKKSEREAALQRDELAHLSRVALLAELSGSIAHELNQPLTAILSNAQAALRFLARDPPELSEVGDSLADIVENDKRAGEVIRRLRAMLRREATELSPLPVNELVHDVLRLMRSDLLNRNIEVVVDLAEHLPLVDGDRIQLQQVLMNLVLNACDAMGGLERGGVITFSTRGVPGGIEVSVRDGGAGIPERDLRRIFEPFVTTKPDGMGLGLAVCRTIAEAHRGSIHASNNSPHPGATVSVVLPNAGQSRPA